MAADLVPVDRLRAAVERIETIGEAVDYADRAEALRVYARRAGLGLQAQNEAAVVKLRAERKAGVIIREDPDVGPGKPDTLSGLGISYAQSSRWQKLARIPEPEFETFLANTFAAGKEITQAAALKLVSTQPRPDRANIAAEYASPPIDAELAKEFGLETSDLLAELVVNSIENALATMDNPKHAFVWAKYHGINDDGTLGDAWTYEGIATMMNTSREYVESLYYRASHHVRGRLAIDLLNQLKILMH